MSVETYTRKFRVCNQCNRAYWHPLNYCHYCPGKLVERELSGPLEKTPEHRWGDFSHWFEQFGLKEGDC